MIVRPIRVQRQQAGQSRDGDVIMLELQAGKAFVQQHIAIGRIELQLPIEQRQRIGVIAVTNVNVNGLGQQSSSSGNRCIARLTASSAAGTSCLANCAEASM